MSGYDARIHAPKEGRPRPGDYVLYWMQTTHRSRDNFALNFAVEQANALGLPVAVYHGLRPDYPWANDRIHTFILESVADLYQDFAARGIPYAFYLERESDGRARRRSPLVALAERAAVVVTDYYPTFIVPRQTKRLREKVETPVVAVDSCTVVPMAYFDRAFSTARSIRPRLHEALPHFLHPVGNAEPAVRRAVEFPFDPTVPARPGDRDSSGTAIAELVAQCDVDHSVPPAPDIRGGMRAARERLEAFTVGGLRRYAEARNDPNDPEATSGLSPYLHFGNIAIHEALLRCRAAGPAEQYDKFQDEALVWRELAHNFVHRDRRHRTVSAIPDWARRELEDHQDDPRAERYSAAQLERAETESPLWNAAQRWYLERGTMHNYLRMLWGKSVLGWTGDYRRALRILEDLNNKYSLDGRDPNSYGGIHWIFGKFDRPFYRRPVFGTVRYMSLKAAEKKFDVRKFIGESVPRGTGEQENRGTGTAKPPG